MAKGTPAKTPAKKPVSKLAPKTAAKKAAKTTAKKSKTPAKRTTRKPRANGDWQLEGGWIDVTGQEDTPAPTSDWIDPPVAPVLEAHEAEMTHPVAAAQEPRELPLEPDEPGMSEVQAPEPETMSVPEVSLTAKLNEAEAATADDGDGEGDDEEEPVPEPEPVPDGPIHPEREPAPIEHPEKTPTTQPEESGGDDIGMVVMDEPAGATVMAQRAQRAAMPLSQEMPAKGDIASGLSLPEQFLLVAHRPGWDDKMEKARPGSQGAAVVGSLLLELALRGVLKVQRGRFTIEDAEGLTPELAAVAAEVQAMGNSSTQVAMEKLTKGLPDRIRPWVQALERRGVLREERSRRLAVMSRSELILTDQSAKERLENRLVRTLAGGGNPDARTIMLLGLVSASGLLRELVPASAYDYNRKRITALLSGRDTLSYRVDNAIRRVQDMALQTVLQDIRVLQGT